MERRLFFVLGVVLAFGMAVSLAQEPPPVDLEWLKGGAPPDASWAIEPHSPAPNDVIYFTAYTATASNLCFAHMYYGKDPPTLDIHYIENECRGIVLLKYNPDYDITACLMDWSPVYGFMTGHFGPLASGNWAFTDMMEPPDPWTDDLRFNVSWLNVLEPNGGEALSAATTCTIQWKDRRSDLDCPGSYLLEYSSDNGRNWLPVDSNSISDTCSYDWTVPSINSEQCLVRVVDADDPDVSDTSDAAFTIYECTLRYDHNGDCIVDFSDLALLAAAWMHCGNPFDPNCAQ